MIEQLRFEGSSGGHLVQPPAPNRVNRKYTEINVSLTMDKRKK